MNEAKLKHFKKILIADRAELAEDLNLTNESFAAIEKSDTGDLVDQATNFYEKELVISLSKTERDTLEAIDKALERIDKKTFGYCEVCNKEIDEKRLEAIPYTTLCMDCKKRMPKKNTPNNTRENDFVI